MNVYREIVEFRARPGIVGSLLRLAEFELEDEIGTRHIKKCVGGSERVAWIASVGRRLEDRPAHGDRIVAPVLGKVVDETGNVRGLARGHRAPADYGEQAIRALVMLMVLMVGTGLAPDKVMIEQLHARIGDWRRRRDRWRTVVIL